MKKILALVLLISTLFSILVPCVSAAEAEVSEVLADLCAMTFDGKAFDQADYPRNSSDRSVHLLAMTELGFEKDGGRDDYTVYLYFHNPSGIEFDFDSTKNKIQMGIDWNSSNKTVKSDKFRLELVDVSDDPGLKNVYLKYRLVDKRSTIDGMTMAERQASTRIYNMSGVELLINGASNATEYELGDSYIIKGFDENNSKMVTATRKSVLTVEVKHTYWRSQSSYKGANYKQQLNAVYFAVPNSFKETYGNLEKIHASWYQYETEPIIVTDDLQLYNGLLPYRGVDVGYNGENSKIDVPSYGLYTGLVRPDKPDLFPALYYDFLYNKNLFADLGIMYPHSPIKCSNWMSNLGWLLYSNEEISVGKDTVISAKEMTDYLNRFVDKYPLLKDYNADDMESHYIDRTIDMSDSFSFANYASTHNWIKAWSDFGFSKWGGYRPSETEVYPEMLPIEIIDSPITYLSVNKVKEKYHIYEDVEAKEFQRFVADACKKDCFVVMLRYLQSDYYSEFLNIDEYDDVDEVEGSAFVAWQTAVIDFDVLDLHGSSGSVSVLSNPINFVAGDDAPEKDDSNENVPNPEKKNWLLYVFAALAVLGVFIAVPYIVKVIAPLLKNKSVGSSRSYSRSRSRTGTSSRSRKKK